MVYALTAPVCPYYSHECMQKFRRTSIITTVFVAEHWVQFKLQRAAAHRWAARCSRSNSFEAVCWRAPRWTALLPTSTPSWTRSLQPYMRRFVTECVHMLCVRPSWQCNFWMRFTFVLASARSWRQFDVWAMYNTRRKQFNRIYHETLVQV